MTRTLSHSDSGNRGADAAAGAVANKLFTMAYDATDRLASVSTGATVLGAYVHNALGQRVSKTRAGGAVTHYLYDLSGRLIAEADGATGATGAEYIAFEGMNLAWITTTGIYWIHGDHLGTPQVLTDATGAEAWSALYSPFGVVEETGPLDFNLRFPGQYHDSETEYYYNYYRTYDPTSGRYVESDPIGLRGGWNTYGYVGGNPVMRMDPRGLLSVCWDLPDDVGGGQYCETIPFVPDPYKPPPRCCDKPALALCMGLAGSGIAVNCSACGGTAGADVPQCLLCIADAVQFVIVCPVQNCTICEPPDQLPCNSTTPGTVG